jgi:hypothetical protein
MPALEISNDSEGIEMAMGAVGSGPSGPVLPLLDNGFQEVKIFWYKV